MEEIRTMNKQRYYYFWTVVLALLLGGVVGWQIDRNYIRTHFSFRKIHIANNNFKFINPVLGFDISQTELRKYSRLDSQISGFIKDQINQKKAASVSVYFRDLEKGGWFGVNEDDMYEPGSLIKVAIMAAYFKNAQSDPSTLNKKILYKDPNGSSKIPDTYNKSPKLREGNYYTAEALIEGMIIDSDNIAKDLLVENIDSVYLSKVFSDLGIRSPEEFGVGGYKISPKAYSLFFRILYNSTYLDTDFSELAIELLGNASFKDGLVAGVPSDVSVAHKFGESVAYDGNHMLVNVELHDCGVVFYPKEKPYFLCVMTKGYDFNDLSGVIKNISSFVFDYVKANQ